MVVVAMIFDPHPDDGIYFLQEVTKKGEGKSKRQGLRTGIFIFFLEIMILVTTELPR